MRMIFTKHLIRSKLYVWGSITDICLSSFQSNEALVSNLMLKATFDLRPKRNYVYFMTWSIFKKQLCENEVVYNVLRKHVVRKGYRMRKK